MEEKKKPRNEYSIDSWYQQTVSKLYRFTYSLLQNREEAEDITQETYFRCLRKGSGDLPPYPYLKEVARNLIYDRYRHWQRQRFTNQAKETILSDDHLVLEDNWIERAFVQELMSQLPEQYRQVLELRIVEGYSRQEVAERMGRSEDAIRGLQYRALQTLRDLIHAAEENGG